MPGIDYQLKFILLGDGGVGKTSLRKRFMGEGFKEEYLATIGVDLSYLPYQYEKFQCSVVIWDIAGQDEFRSARKLYYSGAHAALYVLDLTRELDLGQTRKWLSDLSDSLYKSPMKPIFLGILANKSDLVDQRKISEDDLQKLVELIQNEYNEYIEPRLFYTSAKTGSGVEDAFDWEITNTIEKLKKIDPSLK